MKKITVLMTVYNRERYLGKAIESIQRQSYNDFDLLILDDCSTDSSLALIKQYQAKDPRIRLYQNEVNKGVGATRKRGMELADTPYVAHMDSDDIALPYRLERQLEFLESNPQIDLVGSAITYINRPFSGKIECLETNEQIEAALFFRNVINNPTIFMKREAFLHDFGYNENSRICEDYELFANGVGKRKYANINEVFLKYRRAHSNLTHSNQWANTQQQITKAIKLDLLNRFFPSFSDSPVANLVFGEVYELTPQTLAQAEEFLHELSQCNHQEKRFCTTAFDYEIARQYYRMIAKRVGQKEIYAKAKRSDFYRKDFLTAKEKAKLFLYSHTRKVKEAKPS